MQDATPRTRTTTTDETVAAVATGFAEHELVRLGDYAVTRLEAGWDTQLVFTRLSDAKTFTKVIDSDGPTHAATAAVDWWLHDAWSK